MFYNRIMKTALVLSGGGAKGAYEIGVWKALRELGEEFAIVTGASIGSLNALFVAQDAFDEAEKGWLKFINAQNLFADATSNDPQEFKSQLIHNAFKGGSSTEGVRKVLNRFLNEEIIRKSPTRYGCVIVNAKTFKHREVSIDDIPEGQLFDYAIASCSLHPIFKIAKIDNKSYMDGGWYDNIPTNLAIDMGAERAIVVDLKAPGNNHRRPKKKIEIIKITPSRKTESIILFDEERVKNDIKLGYLDAMKVYGKLDGKYYFFKLDCLNEKVREIQVEFLKVLDRLSKVNDPLISLAISTANNEDEKRFRIIVDRAGKTLEIDSLEAYDFEAFNKALLSNLESHKNLLDKVSLIEAYLGGKDVKLRVNRDFLVACYLVAARRIYG